ncbi:FAD-binding oxidoreductase [Salipiger bermudensis]|uniref:FAD-binding oxidoreductase n=1 Tax=Salipiger bermudensis TaxID=344736 RepID=UPI001CD236C1|nr:FAD-binding oxidoreductase [Salipiger bermudensis]MCA0963006.1 FAD-binding oxidoreductase [Salipiger bermudensis]
MTDDDAFLRACEALIGPERVLTEASATEPYHEDWTGKVRDRAIAVLRPASTQEVSDLVTLCARHNIAIVPQGGRTGLCGGGVPAGEGRCVVLSTDRMTAIRGIDAQARTLTVEAGVILELMQKTALEHELVFPLTFGAQGSCRIGGALATNAGGSNVVRYGTTRELCLGIEAVLPDGSIVNDLAGLRKDNTGYDLRHLLIGAEGTLGIITAAVFKLFPMPKVRSAAFLSLSSLEAAAPALNALQDRTGGNVEAFEFMSGEAVDTICAAFPEIKPPLQDRAEVGVFFEVASSRQVDAEIDEDGAPRLQSEVLSALEDLMDEGMLLDAMIAQSEQQRLDLWKLREATLEAMMASGPIYVTDVSLPLAKIPEFVTSMDEAMQALGFRPTTVGHLGDGNLHYTLLGSGEAAWADLPLERAKHVIYEKLRDLGGSFSAEHGIGQDKLDAMRLYKQPSQLCAMRAIKAALDPANLMNPGKLLPTE